MKSIDKFKNLFSSVQESKMPLLVEAAKYGLKPSSLYVEAQAALRYLASIDDRFAILRARIAIRRHKDGILLTHKVFSFSSDGGPSSWKEELIRWLQDANKLDIWRKEILLCEEDKRFICNLLTDEEVQFTENGVIIVK